MSVSGDLKTKSGKKFVGTASLFIIRARYPTETVERAAGVAAANYYQTAKKYFEIIPITELATQPKKLKL